MLPIIIGSPGAVKESVNDYGFCLIIDCHSFPSKPFPFESYNERPRPDICLGTHPFHTPEWLVRESEKMFQAEGIRTAIDYPFPGTIVPDSFYEQNRLVLSLMVEVNRSVYMNEVTGEKLPGFQDLRDVLSQVLRKVLLLVQEQIGNKDFFVL